MVKRKLIIFGILIFLLGASFSSSAIIVKRINELKEREILYVGGSGPGNYSTIQSAIDDANHGDTIYVYNGIYFENVVIDKSINFIGEDRNSTIIDGGNYGNVVHVQADNVNISGFKIQNGGGGGLYVGLRLESDYNTIFDNSISSNNFDGLWVYNSNYNTIKNNIISFNGDDAFVLYSSNHTKIIDNFIDSNDDNGIIIYYPSNNNFVFENTISKNSDNGIYSDSSNNIISCNNISENEVGILFYSSSNNTVIKNNILDNSDDGIYLNQYSDNNEINSNTISNNLYALRLWKSSYNIVNQNIFSTTNYYAVSLSQSSINNQIFHNNFFDNLNNAWDESPPNTWDNNYPSGGNYWDDYSGEDSNGDGIGDINYTIPGGNSQDRYPLMEPWGENFPVASFTYNVEESPVMFDASLSYDRDGDIVSYDWDFGDGNNGEGEIAYHKYCEVGTYDVTLTITDDDGLKDNITKCVDVLIANIPPEVEIFGPAKGKSGVEYEYAFIVTDPDDNEFYIWIDWGDNESTEWIGPYIFGETLKFTHAWSEDGTYVIRAKAKDSCGEGDWFNFQVIIPRIKTSFNYLFLRFFERILDSFPILRLLLGLS